MPATVIVAVAAELAANPGPFQLVKLKVENFVFIRKDGAKHVKSVEEKLDIVGDVVFCMTVTNVLPEQAKVFVAVAV